MGKHCITSKIKHQEYSELSAAQRACDADEQCRGIYQPKCRGFTFFLCSIEKNYKQSSKKDRNGAVPCVYNRISTGRGDTLSGPTDANIQAKVPTFLQEKMSPSCPAETVLTKASPYSLYVVASLTTVPVPDRTASLAVVLSALRNQTLPPNMTVVTIPKAYQKWTDRHPQGTLEMVGALKSIHKLMAEATLPLKLSRPTQDHGPIMKLVGGLKYVRSLDPDLQKQTVLITLDDDIMYASYVFESLVHWSKRYPNAVLAHATATIVLQPSLDPTPHKLVDHVGIKPAGSRRQEMLKCQARRSNYLYGWAGVLYRPAFFNDFFFDSLHLLGKEGASVADDIFISGCLNRASVPILAVQLIRKQGGGHSESPFTILPSMSTSQWTQGVARPAAETSLQGDDLLIHRLVTAGGQPWNSSEDGWCNTCSWKHPKPRR
jgi:hypothetical protein